MRRLDPIVLCIKRIPPDESALDKVIGVLEAGGVIAYPTETVYGLGCDAHREGAVKRIVDLKGRDTGKPMLVLVSSIEDAYGMVESVGAPADALMHTFWPGPLTLVFKAKGDFPAALTDRRGCIGIRLSSDPVCRVLLERFRKPLVSTSANPPGGEPAQDVSRVTAYFNGRVDLIVDDGQRTGTAPSTVLDVSDPVPVLIRPGPVGLEALRNVAGEVRSYG